MKFGQESQFQHFVEVICMATKVLAGGWSVDEAAQIKTFADEQNVEKFIIINSSDSESILGDIVKAENTEFGDILNEKMILFYGMTNKEISKFIDSFKTLGLDRPLFAMVTPHSVKWKIAYLLEHLMEEREQAQARSRK